MTNFLAHEITCGATAHFYWFYDFQNAPLHNILLALPLLIKSNYAKEWHGRICCMHILMPVDQNLTTSSKLKKLNGNFL